MTSSTASTANECFLAVAKGTRVAKIVVETSERLSLDKLFKHFNDGKAGQGRA
ncbi:hypothetical protein M8542_21355 [Amycolatopsis sp. OK19-0408]|uniref:Uncharacterized protein n=1 Tax=Amycolatopsis iheyensis TaxID=2945988 RepID=A0A9X2SKE1_9PSEU|nr:hypothetical protein [Amycolatopsis iheyensis]MCR6485379.1 hypothetical protein [Amycolatopsis iheyensis]